MKGHHLGLVPAVALLHCGLTIAQDFPNRKDIELSAIMSAEVAAAQLELLKTAVREGSCLKVAELTRFPFRINEKGKESHSVWNRTAFCRYFPLVFSEVRRKVILDQKLEEMPAGWRGLSFGNGDFWLEPICPDDPIEGRCPQSELKLRLTAANL